MSMIRKLSSAFSIDTPSSPRVHPEEEPSAASDFDAAAVDEDAAVAAGAAADAAAEAGAAEAAEAADAMEAGASQAAEHAAAHDLDAELEAASEPADSHPGMTVVVVQQQQEQATLNREEQAAASDVHPSAAATLSLPDPPPLRLPQVLLAASAGDTATAAVAAAAAAVVASPASPTSPADRAGGDGGTPIAANKKRALRISFADVAHAAPPPNDGPRPPRPSMLGPRSSVLGPRPSILATPMQQHPQMPAARKSLARSTLIAAALPLYADSTQLSRHLSEETTMSDRKSSVFDLLDRKDGKPQARWRARVHKVLQSGPALLTSLILTIMILYSDSLRQACTPKSADPYFLAFTCFVAVVFSLEAAAGCLANPRYAKTFYFWVDIISTISILLDIPAIVDPIVSTANDGAGDAQQQGGLDNAAQITAASTRAARLAHVTKWMRLWQIIRLWAFYIKHKQQIIDRETFFEEQLEISSQSRVGEKLTELTIRKVVVMVLLVMFAMPVFDVSVGYYGGPLMLDNGGLSMLHASYGAMGNSSAFQAAMQVYTTETQYRLGRSHTGFITDLSVYNQSFLAVPGGVEGLRSREYANFTAQSGPGCDGGTGVCDVSYATFNTLWASQIQGYLEIGRTTFTIIILLVSAIWFIADTDRLVLRPLERMVQLVKDVSENPLAKVSRMVGGRKGGGGDLATGDKALETQVLEASIHKICSLLSVGFGEAGAEVIADNMRSGGDLNPMVPGRKVAAIFGFCDIRSFTDATEVLQEDVMEFVNSIAQIVHGEVALHSGAANKNIGDAFLLVWKLPGSRRETGPASMARSRSAGSGISRMSRTSSSRISMLMGADKEPERREEASNIADQALASFIIIQAALRRSTKLKAFCNREDLSARLPGYQVNMGFGLHVGWAIEGAIGSEHKIDASYLSPHVNMASRLEAATKQYGASILLSEDFVGMLSPGCRSMVRQVDCVTVKGSTKPIGLFTYDVDLAGIDCLPIASAHAKGPMRMLSSSSGSVAEDAATAAAEAAASIIDAKRGSTTRLSTGGSGGGGPKVERYQTLTRSYSDEFTEHPDIVLTRGANPDFISKFAVGYAAYRDGDWPAARAVFLETLSMREDRAGQPVRDGPSATLLRVMAGHNFQAPASWPGYRELTEK
ncbi:Ras guanine nucleotide exchange factor W [Chlorella vulgaris]